MNYKLLLNIFSRILAGLLMTTAFAWSVEYVLEGDGEAPPTEVEKIETPLEMSFDEEEKKVYPYEPILRNALKDVVEIEQTTPFIRDAHANLILRSAYFNVREISKSSPRRKESAAIGAELDIESGYFMDFVKVGISGASSAKISGPEGKGGAKLLQPDQSGYAVMNKAFVELKHGETTATLYRHPLNYPFLAQSLDSKIVPRSHEAYTVKTREIEDFTFVGSYVHKFKNHTDTKFLSPSKAAGVTSRDKGLILLGAFYEPNEDIKAGIMNLHAKDMFYTIYTDGEYTFHLFDDQLGMRFAGQVIYQEAVGEKLLPVQTDFSTNLFGAKVSFDYEGFLLTLAITHVANRTGIVAPWGGNPSFTSLQIAEFDRAGETGYMASLAFDFEKLDIPGLVAYISAGLGDTPNHGKNMSSDHREVNIGADYRFQHKKLQGLWVRGRAAWSDQDKYTGTDTNDYQVYVNYEIPLF